MALIKRPLDLFGLRSDFNRVFDTFFGENGFESQAGITFVPNVDISDDKDAFYVTVEIPGMSKENIKVNVKSNVLTICGEKKVESEQANRNFYRSERTFGIFCRSFELPDLVDMERIEANYKDGLLYLSIPKKEESKPKQIEINIK